MTSSPFLSSQLNINAVLQEAWRKIYGIKLPIFILIILPISCFPLLSIVFIPFVFILGPTPTLFFSFVISVLCAWWLMAMSLYIGVHRANDVVITISESFWACYKVIEKIVYLSFYCISLTLIYYSLHLLIVTGILGTLVYFALFFLLVYLIIPVKLFALPLVITRNYEAFPALQLAYKTMNKHWLNILICYFIMSIILSLSLLFFGIPLIWTMPMFVTMVGVIFRELCPISSS